MQIFLIPDLLIFLYILVAILAYKTSKNILKLSNLGLENYKIKKQKNNYILKLKSGEEVNFEYVNTIKNDIKQVLKIAQNKSIKIERYKQKDIKIEILPELQQYNINITMLKDGYVYFGKNNKNEDIYINTNELTHYLVAGASGSGKSVLQNLLIASFLYNIKNIKNLYLVDLKGGAVEFGRYNNFANNVNVISSIKQLLMLTRELLKEMNNIFEDMSKNNITKLKKDAIIVTIDEYGTIETQSHELEKEDATELKNNLKTLLAKSRAANIKFFIATQKATSDSIDTTLRENLQSKILMKTKSKDAQKATINSLEILDELDINPAKFAKGQYLFLDDTTGDDQYIQAPFVPDNFFKTLKNTYKTVKPLNAITQKNDQNLQKNKAYLQNKSRKIIITLFKNFNYVAMQKIDKNKNSKIKKYANKIDKKQIKIFYQFVEKEKDKRAKQLNIITQKTDPKPQKKGKKMIELNLEEQIQIRKKTYSECKYIKDEIIRKSYFKKLREVKNQFHDLDKKFDDIEFDILIDDARTEIKKHKTSDAGA
ncbi:MAG: FtsK/SpoIIIE domain-containing protein [Bacteroidota bacterium]|nr:FtsK/SpoIIIE domain-containing protein [Bacteroidota bacterium]